MDRALIGYETERLVVRRLLPEDTDAMHAVYGDRDAMRWVGDGEPLDRDGCLRWLEVTERNYATRGYGMATVTWKETGEIVGFCGIVHPGGQEDAELKYALARAWWGRGIASEAAAGMVRHGLERLGLPKIIATVAPANLASHRVLENAGLRHTATRDNEDGSTTLVYSTVISAVNSTPS